jgi:hypothetical protein
MTENSYSTLLLILVHYPELPLDIIADVIVLLWTVTELYY